MGTGGAAGSRRIICSCCSRRSSSVSIILLSSSKPPSGAASGWPEYHTFILVLLSTISRCCHRSLTLTLLLLFPYRVIPGRTSRTVLEEGVADGRRWPVASSSSCKSLVVVAGAPTFPNGLLVLMLLLLLLDPPNGPLLLLLLLDPPNGLFLLLLLLLSGIPSCL